MRQPFLGDVASTLAARLVGLGLGFARGVAVARLLGPGGQGDLASIFVIPNLVLSATSLGIRQAAAVHVGKGRARPDEVVPAVMTAFALAAVVGTAASAAGFSAQGLGRHGLALGLALLFLAASTFAQYAEGVGLGLRLVRRINVGEIIQASFSLAVLSIATGLVGMGLLGATLALAAGAVARAVYHAWWVRRIAPLSPGRPDLSLAMARQGVVYSAALFVFALNYRVDIVLLGHFVPAAEIGIYAVGVTLAEMVWQVPQVLGFVVFAHSASATDAGAFSSDVSRLACRAVLAATAWGLCLVLAAPWLVPLLYGEAFTESARVIQILVPGIVLSVAFKVLNGDLAGRGMPSVALKVYSAAALANVLLNLVLVPRFGILGAALASTLCYAAAASWFAALYHRLIRVKAQAAGTAAP